MTNEPVTLPLNCAHCGGAVTLQFSDYPDAGDGPLDPDAIHHTHAEWRCPYCQKVNQGGFPGKLAWVTKRVEDFGLQH